MARKTVILVLAVLVAAAAALTQRESAHYVHTMFAVPSGRQNSEKTFQFLTNVVTPAINATDQALLVTGELLDMTFTGITGIWELIMNVLNGKPITSKTVGPTIYFITKTPETQVQSPVA